MTTDAMDTGPELSIVVPLYNEADNIRPLVSSIEAAMGEESFWELILVDDGSADATVEALTEVAAGNPRIRVLELARNYGQTAAMQAGFDHARGSIIVSMDGDLQNDPRDIPLLVQTLEEGYDLVVGYRIRRKDRLVTRKIPSWVANALIRWMTGVKIRDNGCSLKAYRQELLQRMRLYSDMHRFIPAMAAATSGARITEVPVRHHPRRFGRSKYGLSRIAKVLADILTIKMIRSFRDRPLRLFGGAAIAASLIALALLAGEVVSFLAIRPEKPDAVVLPVLALIFIGLAVYLVMLGLIAEAALYGEREEAGQEGPVVHEVGR